MEKPPELIAVSATNSVTLSAGALGAPGSPSALTVVAIMENEQRDEKARLLDRTLRRFNVELLLTRQQTLPDNFNGAFTKDDGSSFVQLPPGTAKLKVEVAQGTFEIDLNNRNQMALIRMSVEAHVPVDARNKVYDAVAPFLDHLAYMAGTPILTGLMKIEDEKNQVKTIDLVAPEHEMVLNPGAQKLYFDLAPIYALYREFKNSNSSFYRLLCLFKIMEGIFGVLRKDARQEATKLGITLSKIKEKVPNQPDIPDSLKYLIGKPIKEFYDNVLEKRYRDAASHFLVRDNIILQVSSADERNKFTEMAFVCDLCARIVIANHENMLRQLDAARSASAPPPRP
jgi:hypothetical protein